MSTLGAWKSDQISPVLPPEDVWRDPSQQARRLRHRDDDQYGAPPAAAAQRGRDRRREPHAPAHGEQDPQGACARRAAGRTAAPRAATGWRATPEAITVAEVIVALEGPIALTACIEHGPGECGIESLCPARANWQRINDAIRQRARGHHHGRDGADGAIGLHAGDRPGARRPLPGDASHRDGPRAFATGESMRPRRAGDDDGDRARDSARLQRQDYKYGFVTDIEAEIVPKGLDEDDHPRDLGEEGGKEKKRGASRRGGGEGRGGGGGRRRREEGEGGARAGVLDGGVRQRLGGDDVPREARRARHHLLLVLRGGARASRAGEEVSRLGGALHRQLLRDAQLGGVQRRLVRLHPEGRALPDGAVDLLPHQRQGHRAVRAHADHRRRGRLRQLPRRLHGADARREPAARRGGRAGGARRRRDQVLDHPELVSGRQGRQGRHLQLRDQARPVRGRPLEDHLDAGRDRLGDHLEVSELHPAGRQLDRRVLLGRHDQQLAAGRHRHEDDPHRQEHAQHDRLEGHLRRPRPEHLSRPGTCRQERQERAQLLAVRLAAHRRQVRRAHVPVPRDQEHLGEGRARGVDVEDRRGPDLLLPPARHLDRGRRQHDRQRLLQGSVPRAADGVRGRSAEAVERELGRIGRFTQHVGHQESAGQG